MSARRGTGAACGKVILLGEHAVVHGAPALAVGIDRGARATATPLAQGPSMLVVSPWGARVRAGGREDLARAFAALLEASGSGAVAVEARAELPPGAGLGCSAALGVAVARALDPSADDRAIADRTMAWERVFHGNPSGVDATVAATGAAILFRKDRRFERAELGAPLSLCLGHSGIASSTRAMVELVARELERRPGFVRETFAGIESLVLRARAALAAGDLPALGELLDLGQALLAGLALSTPDIERLASVARGAGALGAKLTGAGGGGSVVALARDRRGAARVLEAWRGAGYEGFVAEVHGGPARARAGAEAT